MVQLGDSTCPNKRGGGWFAIAKHHPIGKFKRHLRIRINRHGSSSRSTDPVTSTHTSRTNDERYEEKD